MANSVLSEDRFHNEDAAFEYVESQLWPRGPVCPHCQNDDQAKIGRLSGKTTRAGLRKCYACRKPFTVRMGTIFEESKLPLRFWLQAIHLMCASKKGVSTRQLQRILGCGMKTAWHLGHRIRFAMAPGGDLGPLGGSGKIVEADETELARSRKTRRPAGFRRKSHNPIVMSLVERGGDIRSTFLDHRAAMAVIRQNVHHESRLVTDTAVAYRHAPVASHETVDHSKFEFVRDYVHTNTLEGFFSVLKRGLVGVYQHVDSKHLDRYLAEFDFRQNTREKLGINDDQRAAIAVRATRGKRLTYQTTHSAMEA
ncbi:MAG TPA: IS1595 family transposase [Bradyrhizobium sp.]|uniref:IS1595 family transposase n=1 Tax=Bradyrhizobium sp. TaxID=376 RepID=UPI002B8D3335|nr:IS1595 family transposase [Bradyrhizobium sp.]HLZ05219.1 IS1595 family transposase [Bradyrhizobium sp.]